MQVSKLNHDHEKGTTLEALKPNLGPVTESLGISVFIQVNIVEILYCIHLIFERYEIILETKWCHVFAKFMIITD